MNVKEEYKKMIIEWVETEYVGLYDSKEFKNIMNNINIITDRAFKKINDSTTIEEELELVWSIINDYKGV